MELPGDLLNELTEKTQAILDLGAVIYTRGYEDGVASVSVEEAVAAERQRIREGLAAIDSQEDSAIEELLA